MSNPPLPQPEAAAALPRRIYTTRELAELMRVLPDSIRTAVWRNGHYAGIKPIRLSPSPRARLIWPANAVDALFRQGGAR